MKVVVAMSGGVDSSVAAALLQDEGHQVIGITMQVWPRGKQEHGRLDGCCGLGAIEDARKVSRKLGIPHYVMDCRDIFAQKVITDFCQEYIRGRTPNPCIRCNQHVKFGTLLERTKQLGADFIATGHYARVEKDEATGSYLLKKGIDHNKDQSYFLSQLTQEQLCHTLLPLGNLTKEKVREIARLLGLAVADKPASQEICFIPGDYSSFLEDYIPQAVKPGPILDKQGDTVGKHRGITFYTIGQRKGIGLSAPDPLYVTAIEPERNAVVVGNKKETYGKELVASGLNWISITAPEQSLEAKAKIRYHHQEAEANITPLPENKVYVKFKEPQMAITPGQAIVFYDGDTVIGGGTIAEARKQNPIWPQ